MSLPIRYFFESIILFRVLVCNYSTFTVEHLFNFIHRMIKTFCPNKILDNNTLIQKNLKKLAAYYCALFTL